jgi:HAE1 family hydrophobic/amphiphilic exporter-1
VDPAIEPVMTIAVSQKGQRPLLVRASDGSDGRERSSLPASGTLSSEERGGRQPGVAGTSPAALVELKETARALIKRRIEQVAGVAQASVLGGVEREIQVEIDTRKGEALGVTLDQVSQALAGANLNLPGGTIKRGLFRYSLRTLGEFTGPDQVKSVVVIRLSSGRTVAIGDIGIVLDAFKERTGITRYNGEEIIALQIRKEAGSNTVEVSHRIKGVLGQLRAEYPNLRLDVINDQAEFISQSIGDVEQAIVIGASLAFLVLFFFLRSAKYPVIIGIVTPISILATFVAMYFLRINLNIISLTGLALGIGMLGDNAIVVIENITRLRESGMGILEAALHGAEEINLAVTASTLTNVAIFLPVIFVEGVASQLFVDMGITMTISLLVSLLVAATLVPMLVSREVRGSRSKTSVRKVVEGDSAARDIFSGKLKYWLSYPLRLLVATVLGFLSSLSALLGKGTSILGPSFYRIVDSVSITSNRWLEAFLEWGLSHRLAVVVGTLAVFAASVGVALFIPSEPAPDIDQSRFTVQVDMPKGTTLEGTSSFIGRMERDIGRLAGVKGLYSSIGMPEEQTVQTVTEASMERGTLEIRVNEGANTESVIRDARSYLESLKSVAAGAEFAVKKRGTTFEQILRPEQNDVKIWVAGRDPQVATRVADELAGRLRKVKGLVDLRTSMQKGSPEFQIVIDRERASRYGLSVQAVAQHLAQFVRGKEATYLSDFDRKIAIRVQATGDQRANIDDILSASIQAGDNSVPVRELVRWQRTEGYAEVWRENRQRAVLMTANVSGSAVGSVVDDIQKQIKEMNVPAGYTISVGGENEEIRESFRSLFLIILLSLFLVYMILAAEYESILYPLVIILTSPLAFIGAILAMVMAGQAYNVMSLIGIVIMIGAVDNDAVIAVDIITDLRRKGIGLNEAVMQGMKLRLRPILMTTATTVLGVIPLVFEFGTGSELVRALTIPLVGGLIASTAFTIVAIPIVYTYIDRWAIGRKA